MAFTFFGTDLDHAQIYGWLLAFPGMKIFEDYSFPDQTNRWFDSWDAISALTNLKHWPLAAWSETLGGRPRPQQVVFDASTQRKLGAKGRTVLHSPAMIKLGANNEQNGCLANSAISCWTEKGARQRSIYSEEFLDEIDWPKLRSTVGKLERQITKSAPAKMRSYPIMPDAFQQLRTGQIKLWNWGTECTVDSPLIALK
jgi:hypothetical protein